MQYQIMLLSRYLLEASAGLGLQRDEAIDYSYCTDSDLDSTPREERSNNRDGHSTSSEESSTSSENHPTVSEELGAFRFPVIQTVVIKVEAPDLDQSFPYTPLPYPWFGSLIFSRQYELAGVDFASPDNPRVGSAAYKLAGSMADALHHLLLFPAQDHTDYSEYVFANVGEFRIVVAGETMMTVYVGSCYNELYHFEDSPGGSRSHGQEVPWVRRAAERRRRQDLDRNCNDEQHAFLLRPVPPSPSMSSWEQRSFVDHCKLSKYGLLRPWSASLALWRQYLRRGSRLWLPSLGCLRFGESALVEGEMGSRAMYRFEDNNLVVSLYLLMMLVWCGQSECLRETGDAGCSDSQSLTLKARSTMGCPGLRRRGTDQSLCSITTPFTSIKHNVPLRTFSF